MIIHRHDNGCLSFCLSVALFIVAKQYIPQKKCLIKWTVSLLEL